MPFIRRRWIPFRQRTKWFRRLLPRGCRGPVRPSRPGRSRNRELSLDCRIIAASRLSRANPPGDLCKSRLSVVAAVYDRRDLLENHYSSALTERRYRAFAEVFPGVKFHLPAGGNLSLTSK